jgi:hypothetical protein
MDPVLRDFCFDFPKIMNKFDNTAQLMIGEYCCTTCWSAASSPDWRISCMEVGTLPRAVNLAKKWRRSHMK